LIYHVLNRAVNRGQIFFKASNYAAFKCGLPETIDRGAGPAVNHPPHGRPRKVGMSDGSKNIPDILEFSLAHWPVAQLSEWVRWIQAAQNKRELAMRDCSGHGSGLGGRGKWREFMQR
jgi:hypothetical protein